MFGNIYPIGSRYQGPTDPDAILGLATRESVDFTIVGPEMPLADGVADIIGRGHVNLVETLAEDIAAMCLNDRRVLSARVRVEKLDILEHAQSVGVEIERINSEV